MWTTHIGDESVGAATKAIFETTMMIGVRWCNVAKASARCMQLTSRAASKTTVVRLVANVECRVISSSAVRLHGNDDHDHDHDHDHDFVTIGKKNHGAAGASAVTHTDFDELDDEDEDEADMVNTAVPGPSGIEYGGPQRGGLFKEPTRFGDWERKGRCTDF